MIKKWFMKWYTRYWVNHNNCSGITGIHEYCSKCPAYRLHIQECE